MPNPERQLSKDLTQLEPRGQDMPRAIKAELKQEPADTAKLQRYPAEGKIPGARRLDKTDLDKGEMFRLQDELERLQKEMRSEINIANKISRQLKDEKDEFRAQQVREKYEPKITKLAGELREIFGEKKGVEDLLPQLKKQAKESEEKRTQKIREDRKEAAADKTALFHKIPITPELRAVQKKAAQQDIENAYAKLVDAEEVLAKAEEQRPNAFSRFFSRSKVGKVSVAENAYQRALRAVEDAKKLVAETEKSILDSGILYTEPKKRKRFGRNEEPLVAPKKSEKATPHKPAIQAGEYEIKFKPEPTWAQRKVEVNLPPVESEQPREQTADEKFAELTRRIMVYGETKNIGAITDYDYVSPTELTDEMIKKLFVKAEKMNKSAWPGDKNDKDSKAIRKGLEHFRIYGATTATAESTRARAKARGAAIKREITPPDYSSIGGGGLGIDSVVKAMRIKK